MPVFGTQMFGSAAESTFSVAKSCMFDYPSASYLTRTPGSAGNRRTWTMSAWLKVTRLPSTTGGGLVFYKAGSTEFRWSDSNDQMYLNDGSSFKVSTGKLRDTTGWFHLCIIADTPQSTASDRFKVYINGVVPTLTTDSAPAQNFDFDVNDTQAQEIGKEGSNYWDGYMAEFHLIDGTAKVVGDFGETNDEGVWVPKKYTGGGYGTCGFHLDFADSADLGDDNSGEGNDWTPTNMAAAHQSSDSPTNNHCTWNYNYDLESSITLSEGCQNFLNSAGSQDKALGTMFPRHGKWYWEVKWVSGSSGGQVGLSQCDVGSNEDTGNNSSTGTGISLGYRSHDGDTYKNSTLTSFGASWAAGDIIGVAWDVGNGKIYFAKNNTWQNSGDPTSGATGTGAAYTISSTVHGGGGWGPAVCNEGSSLYEARFDEAKWDYSAPSGYKALCTSNMDEPAVKDPSTNFQQITYSGTGSSNARTFGGTSDMQPDILWIKTTNTSGSWAAFNPATGVQKYTMLNNRDNLVSDANSLTAFGSDGFTVGSASIVNDGSNTFIAMGWSAGNSGASNTDGSINTGSTYADQTAGISVGTYTGTGSVATVGHGLGATPDFVLGMSQSYGDHKLGVNWQTGVTQFSEKIVLDKIDDAFTASTNCITAASSTTFTIGTERGLNENTETFQYYAFREIEGFSKFGTFIGNADAAGPFCYCGFTPAMVIIKADKGGGSVPWVLFSRANNAYLPAVNFLYPNDSNEVYTTNDTTIDFLSNGFKIKGNDDRINDSGQALIYMAFAENPIGGENVAPSKSYF